MMRLLRNNRLYRQISEIKQLRSSVRRSEYRNGLRLKRLAVRSRVYSEIAQIQTEKVRLLRDVICAMGNVSRLAHALQVQEKKLNRLKEQIEKHNEKVPEQLVKMLSIIEHGPSEREDSGKGIAGLLNSGNGGSIDKEAMSSFHTDMTKRMERLIPGGPQKEMIRELTNLTLKDSIDKMQTGSESSAEVTPLGFMSSLIKELDLSRKEVEDMLTEVEGGSGPSELRDIVLNEVLKDQAPHVDSKK